MLPVYPFYRKQQVPGTLAGQEGLEELQHPAGLHGLAGGTAGGEGLPHGGRPGPGPAAGEGTRALERGAQPHQIQRAHPAAAALLEGRGGGGDLAAGPGRGGGETEATDGAGGAPGARAAEMRQEAAQGGTAIPEEAGGH